MQIVQTQDEVLRLFDEWGMHYAPSNVIQNEKNAKLLADYVFKTYGLMSITYLSLAVSALASQLDLVPEPKQLTPEEKAAIFQKREFARIQKEQLENSKPFSERVKAENAKRLAEEETKRQADAKGALAIAISGYQCYKTNGSGVDYTTTELMQKELSAVVSRSPNGQRDYVRNLVAVRQIIQELPDHPKMGDVARTLEQINARLQK